ncbi:MAG: DUF4856 domain-containing protein [Bacteroidetes bacterium]|nr:DUF4856 domain-containing protein [Bacteroidota bacterium]
MKFTFFKLSHFIVFGLFISSVFISCKKDKDEEPTPTPTPTGYTVPTTYNFTNVNYSGQTIRLSMLDSISTYMSTGNSGAVLSAVIMKNMYSNTGSPFGNPTLDASGKQLKNKTYLADQTYFDALFDSLAVVSQSAGGAAANGVAGIENGRLFDKNGVELSQVIKKQLMGAVFYYQALDNYLTIMPTQDNTTIVAGQGTTQEHSADEAFGYFGAPVDFPTNVIGLKYWGAYCNEVNTPITCSTPTMNAFLKLRAAVSNKDNTTRDAQIVIVKNQWERIVAASAILELTEAKAAFGAGNLTEMKHVLSEGVGFINALKYNTDKQITNTEITNALNALGTNFYTISIANIDNAINTINAVYGFNLSAF